MNETTVFLMFIRQCTKDAARGFGMFCSNLASLDVPALREILGQAVTQEVNPATRKEPNISAEDFQANLERCAIELLVADFYIKHKDEINAINQKVLTICGKDGEAVQKKAILDITNTCAPINDDKYAEAIIALDAHQVAIEAAQLGALRGPKH